MLFDAVFNRQKTRTVNRSFGTRILRTVQSQNSAKIIQNSQSDQGGGRSHNRPPPEYATGAGPPKRKWTWLGHSLRSDDVIAKKR